MFHKLAKRQTVRIRKACVFKVLVIQDVLNQEYWSTNRENPKTIPANRGCLAYPRVYHQEMEEEIVCFSRSTDQGLAVM